MLRFLLTLVLLAALAPGSLWLTVRAQQNPPLGNGEPTQTSIKPSQNPSAPGQPVTFTVTVIALTGKGIPAGTVNLKQEGTQIATSQLDAAGKATFVVSKLAAGTHKIVAEYIGIVPYFPSLSEVLNQQVTAAQASGPPPFTVSYTLPDNACICTPLVSNGNLSAAHTWLVKAAGGNLKITVIARAVNATEPERVDLSASASTGTFSASVAYSGAEAAATPGLEKSASVTVTGLPGGEIVKVEVTTPAPSTPSQSHYRLKFEGATLAGIASPSFSSLEGEAQAWVLSVRPNEPLEIDLLNAGASGPLATRVDYRLSDSSGALVRSGTAQIGEGAEISVPVPLPGAWLLEVVSADGHFMIDKVSGTDRGLYSTWVSGGRASKTVTVRSGGAPAAGNYTVKLMRRQAGSTGQEFVEAASLQVSNGAALFKNLMPGRYRVQVVPPPGIVAPPVQEVDFLADEALPATVLFDVAGTVKAVVISVAETITVTDSASVVPPAVISVSEEIRVTDSPAVVPPAVIEVSETITVTDAPIVTPPVVISITEEILVSDAPAVITPAVIYITESIVVADSLSVRPPAVIAVTERINVGDVVTWKKQASTQGGEGGSTSGGSAAGGSSEGAGSPGGEASKKDPGENPAANYPWRRRISLE